MSGFLPLFIDETAKARIAEVRANADARPIPLEAVSQFARGVPQPDGFYDDFSLLLPMGFPVVYTHEVQKHGLLRHLSMSVKLEGRVPNPVAVQMVMEAFGFVNPLARCIVYEQPKGVINVLDPLDGDWTPYLFPCSRCGTKPTGPNDPCVPCSTPADPSGDAHVRT